MLSKSRMNNTTVEQNFGGIGDAIKFLQRLVEFVIVIVAEGRYPSLDFLSRISKMPSILSKITHLFQRHREICTVSLPALCS